MTNTMVILGNGFSISLINEMKQMFPNNESLQNINLTNLFANGDKVPCPYESKEIGFLSYQYCPNLWTLGARPDISDDKANSLISDIVTCANAFLRYKDENKTQKNLTKIEGKIYLLAYCELIEYIKNLMIYYNTCIDDTLVKEFLKKDTKWQWGNRFKELDEKENKVTLITYNYDILLERVLTESGILFDKLQKTGKMVRILKPHGSIDFVNKHDISPHYEVEQNLLDPCKYEDIDIAIQEDRKGLIIPPAGESIKSGSWSKTIREETLIYAKELREDDKIIICGISYWNVDRYEIDSLLCSVSSDVQLEYINPFPPSEFNATLMTIFKKYKLSKSSKFLKLI